MLSLKSINQNLNIAITSKWQVQINYLSIACLALMLAICLIPETSLAGSIEAQLTKVNTLTDKGKTVLLTGVGVFAAVLGVARAKFAYIGIAGLVLVVAAITFEWIKGGMVLLG